MVVHNNFSPNIEFEASLVDKASSRTARVAERNPGSKTQNLNPNHSPKKEKKIVTES